jgi:hypothetical protein
MQSRGPSASTSGPPIAEPIANVPIARPLSVAIT